jgi:4'-phosphopantetheinyl transferase
MTLFSLSGQQTGFPENSVNAWFSHLDDVSIDFIHECKAVLSKSEQHRQQRISSIRDQQIYITSHALLREALSCFTETDPKEWQFVTDVNGKPAIEHSQNVDNLQFSLTHCRSACGIIITRGVPCGIDIEDMSRLLDIIRVANRMFTSYEVEQLHRSNDSRRDFFRLWTLREACAKATGQGLANSARSFGFELGREEIIFHGHAHDPANNSDWQLETLKPFPGHMAAIATQGLNDGLKLFTYHAVPA